MSPFERAIKHTIGVEGDYSDDAADSGGKTRFGITEAVARAFGYEGSMKELPYDTAVAIYRKNYWDMLRLDDVSEYSDSIALEVFDTSVNIGTGTAGRFLQRILNVMNREGKDYPDITVDGHIGLMSIASLKAFLHRRGDAGEKVIVEALNSLQGEYYISLAEQRPKDEAFAFGWFLNRVVQRVS